MTAPHDHHATAADLDRATAQVRRTVGWALQAVGLCVVLGAVVGVAVAVFAGAAFDTTAGGTVGFVAGVVATGAALVVASAFVPSD